MSSKAVLFTVFLAVLTGLGIGFSEDGVLGAECTPIYGGGEVCPKVDLDVDKAVAHPTTGEFRENLFATDPKFSTGDIVTFRLVVRNTGEARLTDVKLVDTFPSVLDFLSGAGRIEGKDLTIEVGDLAAGESETFIIRAQVGEESRIGSAVVCEIPNWVKATGKENGNELTRTDLSRFCVEKEVLGKGAPTPVELPAAGASSFILLSSTFAGAGFFLRKYS